ELIARDVHKNSLRSDKIFIHVDLGAIPETLFESELFGHEKGAFTDAREQRIGRFELAHGGTLFLDEIGNLMLPLQAKLLSVLQNREIMRIGGSKPIPVDIRLVTATNMPLQEMIIRNTFRDDLLFRINTVEIRVPPLRERAKDIPLLAKHFMEIYSKKYNKSELTMGPGAQKKLLRYNWPGNVRELQHIIERAVIMAEGNSINPDDFMLSTVNHTTTNEGSLNLEELEKKAIEKALLKHGGNLSNAAKELGLGRTTLYRKMEKYDL
nr:sigma-54-dependent Fis family transcriptional regulator [Bacteroidota bacterium]